MRIVDPGFDTAAKKRPVNLTLNADLVDRVKEVTDNLSGVVETLLAGYLEQERTARRDRLRVSEAAANAWNSFNDKHGSLGDEFSTL